MPITGKCEFFLRCPRNPANEKIFSESSLCSTPDAFPRNKDGTLCQLYVKLMKEHHNLDIEKRIVKKR